MLPLRLIRRRIKSVENTKKMTRAMEMVAASKLKKLQDLLKQSDRYIGELKRILGTLVREKPLTHPLLENRLLEKEGRKAKESATLVFVITSDTGLCGSYNTNLMERVSEFLKTESKGRQFHFIAIGRNGASYLKRNRLAVNEALAVPKPQEIESTIEHVTRIAVEEFKNGKVDEVFFIYTKVHSLASLKPEAARLFPITHEANRGQVLDNKKEPVPYLNLEVDYILDPNLDEILELMLPEFIQAEIGQFIKNSLVAEQASRMTAMHQATENAKEMIESLTLMRNKARQASITKELLEVVSGSRALQMK
ncbi:MAG TPA: ATP synthase F1 subunit gamma [Candidatus Omnitrophota bacterium]|nr:ATP synthase F1 subunit gamma [Candidatus Omnitrophota bacterium]